MTTKIKRSAVLTTAGEPTGSKTTAWVQDLTYSDPEHINQFIAAQKNGNIDADVVRVRIQGDHTGDLRLEIDDINETGGVETLVYIIPGDFRGTWTEFYELDQTARVGFKTATTPGGDATVTIQAGGY